MGFSDMRKVKMKDEVHKEIMAKRCRVLRPGDSEFEELAKLYRPPSEMPKPCASNYYGIENPVLSRGV